MEIYIEVVYIINCIVLFFTFEILFFLLNCHTNLRKLFHYILSYNISFILLYIDLFQGFILIYYLILSIFYFKKNSYIYYPLFVFIYMSILSFSRFLIKESYIYHGILIIDSINISVIYPFVLFLISLIYVFIYFIKTKAHTFLVNVCFDDYSITGFIDTGNFVIYKGFPVIFMNKKYLNEYMIIDCIEIKSVIGIEYINIVEVKNIKINNRIIDFAYVGLMNECEYDCILNNQILGGML